MGTARQIDPTSTERVWQIRKLVTSVDEYVTEGGAPPAQAALRVTAAAVLRNPWIGTPTDTDLQTPARQIAPRLAKLLADRVLEQVGDATRIEAFGKAALVGSAGEIEHGAALLHTPYYANLLREFFDGSAVISFSDDRTPAGTPILIPMCHKIRGTQRSHYQTVIAHISDAPRADEIIIFAAASTGPRPHHRVGDRTTDPAINSANLEELYK